MAGDYPFTFPDWDSGISDAWKKASTPNGWAFDLNVATSTDMDTGGTPISTRFGDFGGGEQTDMFATLVRLRNRALHGDSESWRNYINPGTPADAQINNYPTYAYWDATAAQVGGIDVFDSSKATLGALPQVGEFSDTPGMARDIDANDTAVSATFHKYLVNSTTEGQTTITSEGIRRLFTADYRPVPNLEGTANQKVIAPLRVRLYNEGSLEIQARRTDSAAVWDPSIYVASYPFSFSFYSSNSDRVDAFDIEVGDLLYAAKTSVGTSKWTRGIVTNIVVIPVSGLRIITCEYQPGDLYSATPGEVDFYADITYWKSTDSGNKYANTLALTTEYMIPSDSPSSIQMVCPYRKDLAGSWSLTDWLSNINPVTPLWVVYLDTANRESGSAYLDGHKLEIHRSGTQSVTVNDAG